MEQTQTHESMTIEDLEQKSGRTYPARRLTKNLVGGDSPIQAENFCMGISVLEPEGGQVPWHNHEQEEVYFLIEGEAEMCIGQEKKMLRAGQAVFIPSGEFHQITNIGKEPTRMLYCYAPAGDVDHWRQELAGTLPKAGVNVPPLPDGAHEQHTDV